MLQVEGRQNWIPENKGAGWRFRTVGTSAQHTKKQDLFVEYRGYAQKQLQARRIILRRLAKSKPGAKLQQCTRDTVGKPLSLGEGKEEESLVRQETRRAAVRLRPVVACHFWSTYITDGCSDLRLRLMRMDRLTHTRVKRLRDPATSSKHCRVRPPVARHCNALARRPNVEKRKKKGRRKKVCCLRLLKCIQLRLTQDVHRDKELQCLRKRRKIL